MIFSKIWHVSVVFPSKQRAAATRDSLIRHSYYFITVGDMTLKFVVGK